jgi:hypothetical protein
MIVSRGSVSGVGEVVCTFVWREAVEQDADPLPCCLEGSFGGFAQHCFEFGEDLLDRIEVRAVGRQEEELGAGHSDGTAHGLSFVTAEIVHNDDVAGSEGGYQQLLDIGEEALAVDRPVDDARRVDPVGA